MILPGSKVILYSGPCYGREHEVVSVTGNWLVCRCGYQAVKVHMCDVEFVSGPEKEAA